MTDTERNELARKLVGHPFSGDIDRLLLIESLGYEIVKKEDAEMIRRIIALSDQWKSQIEYGDL